MADAYEVIRDCRENHYQRCHECPVLTCGDNTSPERGHMDEARRQLAAALTAESDARAALATERAAREAAEKERDRFRADHEHACTLVARMHAAAVGEVTGPKLGVVEDVAAVRVRAEAAEAAATGKDAELARLRAESRRWYRADGTFEELAPEQVIERRKEAAKKLADCDRIRGELKRIRVETLEMAARSVCALCRRGVPLDHTQAGDYHFNPDPGPGSTWLPCEGRAIRALSPGPDPLISSRPDVRGGEPCIAGTRITAAANASLHADGWSIELILGEWQALTREQVEAAIRFGEGRREKGRTPKAENGKAELCPVCDLGLDDGAHNLASPACRQRAAAAAGGGAQ
jgi:uncharacterized protein (DUF433 family)